MLSILLHAQVRELVEVLQQLEQSIAAGSKTMQQARADLDFADASVQASNTHGLWSSPQVAKAISAAKKALALQQLQAARN